MKKASADKKILLVDVRSPEIFAQAHVSGAINIPIERLEAELPGHVLGKEAVVAVYCNHGGRAGRACKLLHELGYAAAQTWGGIDNARVKAWESGIGRPDAPLPEPKQDA